MSAIKSKDTKPEILLRRELHAAGFRFRLHCKDLPGNPDIVLPRYRTAVQVQGCLWHGHTCRRGRRPRSNADYWTAKITRNIDRDARTVADLAALGWHVVVIWECSLTDQVSSLIEWLSVLRNQQAGYTNQRPLDSPSASVSTEDGPPRA